MRLGADLLAPEISYAVSAFIVQLFVIREISSDQFFGVIKFDPCIFVARLVTVEFTYFEHSCHEIKKTALVGSGLWQIIIVVDVGYYLSYPESISQKRSGEIRFLLGDQTIGQSTFELSQMLIVTQTKLVETWIFKRNNFSSRSYILRACNFLAVTST